jgi:hypothetical protein
VGRAYKFARAILDPLQAALKPLPTADHLETLGHLAQVWVAGDLYSPGQRLLAEAVPHIARARQSRDPVSIGPIDGLCVTEALLYAAQWITSGSVPFGCGNLIRIVQVSYPRDVPSDPWEFNFALLWYRAARENRELAAVVAKRNAVRSEFFRSLLTHELEAAIASVNLPRLCDWLRPEYAEFAGRRLRVALDMEFLQAFPPPPKTSGEIIKVQPPHGSEREDATAETERTRELQPTRPAVHQIANGEGDRQQEVSDPVEDEDEIVLEDEDKMILTVLDANRLRYLNPRKVASELKRLCRTDRRLRSLGENQVATRLRAMADCGLVRRPDGKKQKGGYRITAAGRKALAAAPLLIVGNP